MIKENENENTKPKKKMSEPLFDSNPHFHEKEVLLSMYNEIRGSKDKFLKSSKYKEEYELQVKCMQEWFLRCCWSNKYLFIKVLLNASDGCFVLENVLDCIESIYSKDVMESLSNHCPSFLFDAILVDDNRTLEVNALRVIMKSDFFWFIGLDPTRQARTILKLLRLSGGGLIFEIYKLAYKIYEERQKLNILYMRLPSFYNLSDSEEEETGRTESEMTTVPNISEEEIKRILSRKEEELIRRNLELDNYKKIKGIEKEETVSTKKKEEDIVDYLQLLPVWLSRKIISYMDDKSLAELKKVGKYWERMIDESINEKLGRKAINAKINKITEVKSSRTEDEGTKFYEEVEFVNALGRYEFVKKRQTIQSLSVIEDLKKAFSNKFDQKIVEPCAYSGRVCSVDYFLGMLASTFPTNTVRFYSIKSGSKINFIIYGLKATITCLNLHENRRDIFIGCADGSIVCKEIRTNKNIRAFAGHSKAVVSIYTTSSNMLSSSKDNTVKFFNLLSGHCLVYVDFSPKFNLSCSWLLKDGPLMAALGTDEGVFFLVNVETKEYKMKIKIHKDSITQIVNDKDILVTGCKDGIVRVWDLTKMNKKYHQLTPYYNITVGNSVSTLLLYGNSILVGCGNGIVKVISTTSGTIVKAMKISSQSPISGLAITKDKICAKLIIWHEGGIEMRTFSLVKFSRNKKSIKKDNGENKQKAPPWMIKKLHEALMDCEERKSMKVIEVLPQNLKKNIFLRKKPRRLGNCCTIYGYRNKQKKCEYFQSNVFTNVINNKLSSKLGNDFFVQIFPRRRVISKKKK